MRTGHTIAQFHSIFSSVPQLYEHYPNEKTASDALFMYLMKLRTGYSNDEIGDYFSVSRFVVAQRLSTVRDVMYTNLAPKYVNQVRTREELLGHSSRLCNNLFDPENQKVKLICDGTYLFIEKSGNHSFQKKTYSSHKKRNYLKPMVGCATDGTILFVAGPFKATENDAVIMSKILDENIPAMSNLERGDIIFTDRGFRDVVPVLKRKGFDVKLPACSRARQLTREEANQSRFVTKLRYDIERINGVMKNKFKLFSLVADTHWVPHLMKDFTIAAALVNMFRKPPIIDIPRIDQITNRMIQRNSVQNKLARTVANTRISNIVRSKQYNIFDSNAFPRLSMNDLRLISLGDYQINQAKLYAFNHISFNGNSFLIHSFPEHCNDIWQHYIAENKNPVLVMITLKSRFVSAQKYRPYILFDSNATGLEAILEYTCDCKHGKRTVGCCSHVMCILFYMGYARHKGGVIEKARHLRNVFDQDVASEQIFAINQAEVADISQN